MYISCEFDILFYTFTIFDNSNNILVLNGTNFKKLKEQITILLACMDEPCDLFRRTPPH